MCFLAPICSHVFLAELKEGSRAKLFVHYYRTRRVESNALWILSVRSSWAEIYTFFVYCFLPYTPMYFWRQLWSGVLFNWGIISYLRIDENLAVKKSHFRITDFAVLNGFKMKNYAIFFLFWFKILDLFYNCI